MSYKIWNRLLVDHFFNNENEEIILSIDEEKLTQIGEPLGLDYSNFLDSVLMSWQDRIDLYNEIIIFPSMNEDIRRRLNGNLVNVPYILANPYNLNEPNVVSRIELPFFNFIILAVIVMTKNIEDSNNSNASFYKKLNEIINGRLQDNTRVNILYSFDKLFQLTEKYSDGRFKNYQIGTHKYIGLLKYQVVLSPMEKLEFEKLLFENYILVNDDVLYIELANKLFQIVPNNSSLRKKIKMGIKDRCYANWFLNQAINFNHDNYFENLSDDERILRKKTANFAIAIDLDNKTLKLLTDLPGENELELDGYSIQTNQERLEDNFSIIPIKYDNTDKIEFKEYPKIISEDVKIKITPIPINDVNFFQKTNYGFFKQTLTTRENYDTIIVVKNDNKTIENWNKWKNIEENIVQVSNPIFNDLTKELFGDNWIVYQCEGSVKNSYYKNTDNFIGKTNFTNNDVDLDIRRVGGYKIKNIVNSYVDVAPPSFVVDFPEFEPQKLKVLIKRNGVKDSSFKTQIDRELVQLLIDKDLHIVDDISITMEFQYNDNNRLYKKFIDFNIKPSFFPDLKEGHLFKVNSWGEKCDKEPSFNGINITSSRTPLANARHKLSNLNIEAREFSDYFIHLLVGAFNINNEINIDKWKFNEVFETSIGYLRDNNIKINVNEFSKFNLIENLIALGYINKNIQGNIMSYQLNPPSLKKIERSFESGGNQIYKLSGARTKFFTQKFKQFCEEKNIKIMFRSYSSEKLKMAEYRLLPDTFFVDGRINFNELNAFLKEYNLFVNKETDYNLGDSILEFTSSIAGFENKYLTNNPENFSEDFFEPTDNFNFPRIRKDKNSSGNFGNFRHKRLEQKKGKFYSNIPREWMENYVRFKTKIPIQMMKNPKWNGNRNILFKEIYFYKYHRLPSLVFRALVEINHGLPFEKKIFNINHPWTNKDVNNCYSIFYEFDISNNEDRRKKLSKILTGNESYLDNNQIIKTEEISDFTMQLNLSDEFCSNFITIKDSNNIISLIEILPFKKYNIYINIDCFKERFESYYNVHIDSTKVSMLKIELVENIHNTLSQILKKKFDNFSRIQKDCQELKFESKSSEEILIFKPNVINE